MIRFDMLDGLPDEEVLEVFVNSLENEDLCPTSLMPIIQTSPFLKRFIEYAQQCTDAPDVFLTVASLQTISTVLGNRVFYRWGALKIFLHLWVVLVARSSFYRKSTVLNIVKKLIRQVGFIKGDLTTTGDYLIGPDSFTIAVLLEELAACSEMTVFPSEFGRLVSEMKRDFNKGGVETLTEIYDSGRIKKATKAEKEKNQGKPLIVEEAALSIFGASTPTWLKDRITKDDISGGFISRFIFVPAHKKERSLPWLDPADAVLEQEIIKDLTDLRNSITGEVDIPRVRSVYAAWYTYHVKRADQSEDDEQTIGFDQRLPTYAFKFAILYHIATYRNLKLTPISMIAGIMITEYFRTKIMELLGTVFIDKFDTNLMRIAKFIHLSDKEIKRANIQRFMGRYQVRKDEFQNLIDTLQHDGGVTVDDQGVFHISATSKYLKG